MYLGFTIIGVNSELIIGLSDGLINKLKKQGISNVRKLQSFAETHNYCGLDAGITRGEIVEIFQFLCCTIRVLG
jgi:hypothetical protein